MKKAFRMTRVSLQLLAGKPEYGLKWSWFFDGSVIPGAPGYEARFRHFKGAVVFHVDQDVTPPADRSDDDGLVVGVLGIFNVYIKLNLMLI